MICLLRDPSGRQATQARGGSASTSSIANAIVQRKQSMECTIYKPVGRSSTYVVSGLVTSTSPVRPDPRRKLEVLDTRLRMDIVPLVGATKDAVDRCQQNSNVGSWAEGPVTSSKKWPK